MTDRLDVIAAFADGEVVAASDLGAALAHEDARAYLIDVLALRGLVTDARPQTAGSSSVVAARRRWSSLSVVAAAALIVVAVAAGFTAGRRTAGTDVGQATQGKTVVVTSAVAPAPTHVFRMENGVNWNERAGGN